MWRGRLPRASLVNAMRGTIKLPGDKSISHRVSMLAAIAKGQSRFTNFNSGADCASTLQCLSQLGISVEREGGNVAVHSAPMVTPSDPLDCGNSGSTIRMLTGLLAGQNVAATLTGDSSLRKRPMRRLAEPLRQMGADVQLSDNEYAPIVLGRGADRAIQYHMPMSSAQVKSAILLAGIRFPETRVFEPIPSRDHTERLLAHLGFQPSTPIAGFTYDVPADPSSAAFFAVGALLHPGSDITFRELLMNPFRIAFLRKLQQAGARLDIANERTLQNEPVADVRVQYEARLNPIVVEPAEVPSLIDEIPVLSLLGSACGFSVSGARELRFKESDRIHAMVSNIVAMGGSAAETPDGYSVQPGTLSSIKATTFGDHRIAMTFAIAGMELDDPGCIAISFPEFFEILGGLST